MHVTNIFLLSGKVHDNDVLYASHLICFEYLLNWIGLLACTFPLLIDTHE